MDIFRETKVNIQEKEDTILISPDTLLKELEVSSLLKTECKVVWDAVILEQMRWKEEQISVKDSILRDMSSEHEACTIMGGRREEETVCQKICPIGVLIPEIMELVRKGERLEALRHLIQYNPMPSITSRLCSGICQTVCSRAKTETSVDIRELEQILGDEIENNSDIFYIAPSGDSGKQVAILGGNPAGMSAAYHLRRLGNHVTVYIDGSDEMGEMLCYSIENFPVKHLQKYIASLKKMGVAFVTSTGRKDLLYENYDKVLKLEEKEGTFDCKQFLTGIKRGYDEARRINLDFGLKTYLEPAPFFTSVSSEHVMLKQKEYEQKKEKLDGWKRGEWIAGRCLNCASYGVQTSILGSALMALETQVITNERVIRGLDFWAMMCPYHMLKEGETILAYEIPKCSEFQSGCKALKTDKEEENSIILVYAYLVNRKKIMDIRLILSGAAPVPVRLYELEQTLRRKKWSDVKKDIDLENKIPFVPMANNKERIETAKCLIYQLLDETEQC